MVIDQAVLPADPSRLYVLYSINYGRVCSHNGSVFGLQCNLLRKYSNAEKGAARK